MIESMVQSLLPLASWIGFASLKSLLVIPLVLLLRWLCARWLTQQGRYGLWFALLACLAIPFGAQVKVGGETRAATPVTVEVVTPSNSVVDESAVISVETTAAPVTAVVTPDLSMTSTAVLVWLLGIGGLATVVVRNVRRYRRIRSRASEVDPATDALFHRCKQLLKIHRTVRLLETSQVPSPVVVGYWRPTLLLPRTLSAQLGDEQLRLVLLHELTHVQRHDILVNWVVTLVQIAHWFNPLAWYAMRVLRDDMEQACDASVLRHLSASEQTEYGDTLIRLSDLAPPRMLLVQNASVVESRSQLKSRIRMIAQFTPRGVFSSILGAALLALTAGIAVTQAASAPQPPVSAAPPASAASQPASPAATRRAAQGSTESPAPQPTPVPQARRTTERSTVAVAPNADAAELPATSFKLNYAHAKDLVSFIQSAPGIGFLSDKGTIAADESTNTLFVRDNASNVATIRQIVAALDVLPQQVLISAVFAWVENDLIQELTTGRMPDGSWSPVIALGTDVERILATEQQARRAAVIARPRVIALNRKPVTIEQSWDLPPPQEAAAGIPFKTQKLSVSLTPTVTPDNRVTLDVDATLSKTGTVVVMTGGAQVPAIDTSQMKSKAYLESGATMMLEVTGRGPDGTSAARRLVAIVTPTIIAPPR